MSLDPQHFVRQLESAMRAKERNQGPAKRRPMKDRDETLQIWAMKLMQKQIDAVKIHGEGQLSMKNTITSGESPCCQKPLEELQPITLKEMKVPLVHKGRYLVCRTASDPLTMVGTMAIVEDLNGDVEELSMYNFRINLNDASWLPRGTILIVKEPYAKYASMGDAVSMRVDSPSDVVFVDETDRDLLNSVGALKWYKPEGHTAEQLRKKGNECFVAKAFEKALKFYNRALRLQSDNAVVQLNRAATLLQLEFFVDAYKAAEVALAGAANREKALFRLGKAAYGMRNWAVAVEHFERLTTEFPANTEVKLELQRSLDRLEESRTGKYDLPRIYRDAFKLKKHYLDVADYIGPVEVVDIPGKGKGVVCTRDVAKGTLLLVSKAFACSYADDFDGLIMSSNLISKRMDRKTQFFNKVRIVQTLLRNPHRAQELYALYAGDMPRDEVTPEGVIDVARIEQISSYNPFAAETKHADADYGPKSDAEMLISTTPTALYTFPSFLNHSCVGNAYRAFYGDVMMIYSLSDLNAGAEVTLPYMDTTGSLEDRTQKLLTYNINCDCRLCELDRADPNRKERQKLLKKCEELRPMALANPAAAVTALKRLIKQLRQTYGSRKELRIQLFQPLHLLAKAYLPLDNFGASAAALKECMECLDGPFYYAFAPEVCSQVVLCCETTGQLADLLAYKLKAQEAARIRAGIDAELYEQITSVPEGRVP